MSIIKLLLLTFSIAILATSCSVNSHVMFKEGEAEIITDNIPLSPDDEYKLAPDDKFTFTLFVENGKRIIDVGSGIGSEANGSQRLGGTTTFQYLVRKDGQAELPMLGLVDMAGLTVIQAQEKLAKLFSVNYIDPFIQIQVTNRRVIVFPGSGGDAKVIALQNDNTTLMEAIALAGGITERGKASVIKVMRQSEEGRKVYQIDLSTLEGLKYADMIVQSNDYIYIEPTKQLTREFLQEVSPIVSLISSAILVISVFTMFN